MKTVSCKSPFKKALLKSTWRIGQLCDKAKENITLIVAGLMTGLKVSK